MENLAWGAASTALAAAVALVLWTDSAASQDLSGKNAPHTPQLSPLTDEDCSKACRERIKKLERQIHSLERDVRYLQEEVTDLHTAEVEDEALLAQCARDQAFNALDTGSNVHEKPFACNPAFVVDDRGIKRYMVECLIGPNAPSSEAAECEVPFYYREDGVKLMKAQCLGPQLDWR